MPANCSFSAASSINCCSFADFFFAGRLGKLDPRIGYKYYYTRCMGVLCVWATKKKTKKHYLSLCDTLELLVHRVRAARQLKLSRLGGQAPLGAPSQDDALLFEGTRAVRGRQCAQCGPLQSVFPQAGSRTLCCCLELGRKVTCDHVSVPTHASVETPPNNHFF